MEAINNMAQKINAPVAPVPMPSLPTPNVTVRGVSPMVPTGLYFLILISYMLMMLVNRFDLYLREAIMLIMPIMVVGSISHYYPKELELPGPGTFAIAFASAYLILTIFSIDKGMRKKLRNPDEKGNTLTAGLVYLMVAAAFALGMYMSLQFGSGPFFYKG